MEGVSWSTSLHPEAFRRPSTTADTLSRLASFIARVESKQALTKSCKQLPQQQLPEDPALPCTCRKCGESFARGSDLLNHQETHHSLPKLHRCSGCGRAFSLRSSLQLHSCEVSSRLFQLQTRNSPTYATTLIPDECSDAPAFSQPHVLDRSLYACAPCGKGFMLKQALLHHQQAGCDQAEPASPARSDDLSSPDTVDSPLASEDDDDSSNSLYLPHDGQNDCKFCPRAFRSEAKRRRRSKASCSDECDTDSWESSNGEEQTKTSAKSKKSVFSCRSCEMVFSSTAQLSKHRKEEHSRGTKPSTERKRALPVIVKVRKRSSNTYTCQVCSKVFFHHLSLWAHKKKHPVSEFGAVGSDDATSNNTKDFKLIKKPNLENQTIPCKVMVRKSSLTEEAVSAVKMFPPKFPKSSKFPALLKPPKPLKPLKRKQVPKDDDDFEDNDDDVEFPCPSCPEVFSQHSDLKAHAELHQSAVRRSRCSVCSSEMDSLKWPRRVAKRLRLYHCVLCQTGFSTLEPFLSHCQNHLKAKVEEERDPLRT